MDGFQDGELLLHHPLEALLVAQEQVAVPVVLAQHPARACDPGVEPLVNLGQDRGLGRLAPRLHQLLVVVQHQDDGHQAAGLVEGLDMLALGDVHKIGGDNLALAGGAAPHAANRAVDTVDTARDACQLPVVAALQHPLVIKVRGQIPNAHIKYVFLGLGQPDEAVIGPDDIPAVRLEHHHRQGGVEDAVFIDGIHAAGDRLDVLHHVAAAARALAAVVKVEQHQGRYLSRRQQRLDGDRNSGKQG